MVGIWFKERFTLIREELDNYSWEYKRWVQKVEAPSKRTYDYVINQKFYAKGGSVSFSSPTAQEAKEYLERKSYVVWFSGGVEGDSKTNKTRREVYVEFWDELPFTHSDSEIKGWLDSALQSALGMPYDVVSSWYQFSYNVADASMGRVTNQISDYEFNIIRWVYTGDGRIKGQGMISK